MKNLRIGIRYAKALFSLAKEFNKADAIKNDMELIQLTIKGSADLKRFLESPIVREDKKLVVVKELFESKTDLVTLRFVSLIIKKRRFPFIDIIASEYLNLYRVEKGIKPAYLQTTVPVDEYNRNAIIDVLKDYTKTEIELIEDIRKDLIGGFVLKLDDKLYDTSIKAKILRLNNEFSVNTYEKGL
ncbi:MAG: ATP synthase F1 subunit delta [Bacteroidales bacterium]|nr:ATP synthase F1 subunit delta [Bacteroidales bacterium]